VKYYQTDYSINDFQSLNLENNIPTTLQKKENIFKEKFTIEILPKINHNTLSIITKSNM
jgi:hypothetical protein